MRKAFILMIIFILQLALFLPGADLKLAAAKKEAKDKNMKVASEEAADISLLSENYLLEGLVDQVHFYYEVPVDKVKGDNYVYLHVDYSDLLLNGSTLTISVDDKRIKSYSLKAGEKEETFKVPLKGKALERGFHHITVAFYGELFKEMCTNEENPANWLTILSDSYVHLEMGESFAERDNMLADYPYPFVQTNKAKQMQGKIVIPNKASNEILSTALSMANYLNEQTAAREALDIIFEKDLTEIDQNLIAIGAISGWEGILKKHLSKKDLAADELAIYNDMVKNKQLMVITAEKDETIMDLSAILTVDDYVKQLTKNDLRLKNLPTLEMEQLTDKSSFKKMNIPPLELSGVTSQSEFYFYDLPTYLDTSKLAYLHLKLKISKTLLYESEYAHALSELTIYINGVHHSVSIRDLEEDGFYRIAVPVSEATLQKERMMSLQFVGNGLKEREICVPPSEEKWIYVDNSSYLEYSLLRSQGQTTDFYDWPKPFVASEKAANTLVLLTEEVTTNTLKQVQEITNSLKTKNQSSHIKVTRAEQATEEELKENNLLIIGDLNKWDAWEAVEEKALIKRDSAGSLAVNEFGFIGESAKHLAFIQASVWNADHTMAVFSPVHKGEETFVSRELLENLQDKKQHTDMILETVAGDIFTKELAIEDFDDGVNVEEPKEDAPWIFYLFIGIVILATIIFIIVLRRMRKRKISE